MSSAARPPKPRCRGCGDAISGAYLAFEGRDYHAGCLRCDECGAATSSFVAAPNRAGSARCCRPCAERLADRCACGCGGPCVDRTITALGRKFIESHFRCAECDAPPPGMSFMKVTRADASRHMHHAHLRRGGGDDDASEHVPVCEACYERNHAERCGVCEASLVNQKFFKTDVGDAVCARCKDATGAYCDDCGACVPRAFALSRRFAGLETRGASPGGGTRNVNRHHRTARRESGGVAVIGQCPACAATAIDADADAAAILNKVIHAMRGMGAVADAAATIKVQLVDADELARAAAKRHRGPNASGPRGVTRTSVAYEECRATGARRTVSRTLKGILALRGMSRGACGAVLAHEYGHAFMFLSDFPALPLRCVLYTGSHTTASAR